MANNIITVDGEEFLLPVDRETRKRVLNHLRMCLKGYKTHMHFRDKYGDRKVYSEVELQAANILVGGNELKVVNRNEE